VGGGKEVLAKGKPAGKVKATLLIKGRKGGSEWEFPCHETWIDDIKLVEFPSRQLTEHGEKVGEYSDQNPDREKRQAGNVGDVPKSQV